jgi:hypothetical protein
MRSTFVWPSPPHGRHAVARRCSTGDVSLRSGFRLTHPTSAFGPLHPRRIRSHGWCCCACLSAASLSLNGMYLQSRTRRWLHALRYASTILSQGVQMMEYFAAHAHVPGARQISARDKRITALLPTDQIRMTLESQPLVPGSWLAEALNEVTTALDKIDYGDGFVPSIAALSTAIEKAIPVLEERVIEPDESVDEIVADLERSLLISIVAPLTAHNPIIPLVDKWTNDHQRFLQGNLPSDVGHHFAVRTLNCVDEPGPGRVHIQHLVSACDAGMTSFVAGKPVNKAWSITPRYRPSYTRSGSPTPLRSGKNNSVAGWRSTGTRRPKRKYGAATSWLTTSATFGSSEMTSSTTKASVTNRPTPLSCGGDLSRDSQSKSMPNT